MKNENIHIGFTQKEIRDFLSQERSDAMIKSGLVSVEYAEEQVNHFKNILKHAKRVEAVNCLISEKGWEGWDISGNIPYNSETYFSFLGTKEEYDKLMKTLQEEK